jgi:hypothetical protein
MALSRRASLALFTLTVVLNAVGITWGIKGDGETWAADELVPSTVIYYLRNPSDWSLRIGRFTPDGNTGLYYSYPVGHHKVLALASAPYLFVIRGSHGLTPADQVNLQRIFRWTSVILSALTVVLTAEIAACLFGSAAGLFAGLLLSLSFPFVYYGHTANVDMPSLFWFTLALWLLVRGTARGTPALLILGACLGGVAAGTKDQALVFCGLPTLLAAITFLSGPPAGNRRSRWKVGFSIAVGAAAGYLFMTDGWFNPGGLLRHLQTAREGSITADFVQEQFGRIGYAGLFGQIAGHLVRGLTWLGLPWLAAGLARIRRERIGVHLVLLSPVVALVVFALVTHRAAGIRYVLPALVCLSVYAGAAMGQAWSSKGTFAQVARVLSLVTLGFIALGAYGMDRVMIKDSRYDAERWLAAHVPAPARVGSINITKHLPRMPAGVEVVRIDAGMIEMPDYVILTSEDRDWKEYTERLARTYVVRAHFKTAERHELGAIFSVNPDVWIYTRRSSPDAGAR